MERVLRRSLRSSCAGKRDYGVDKFARRERFSRSGHKDWAARIQTIDS